MTTQSLKRVAPWALLGGAGLTIAMVLMLADPMSWWGALSYEIHVLQRNFYREMSSALGAVRDNGWLVSGTLITLSFLYGALHAAGPGHGKVVISTFLLTNPGSIRRGIILTVLAAFMQGLVAILIVEGIVTVAQLGLRDTQTAGLIAERVSYGLMAAVGLWLMIRTVMAVFRWMRSNGAGQSASAGHDHDHGHHAHDHGHGSCGHVHGPTAEQINQPLSWQTMLAVVLSVGMRPCSGALIVLGAAMAFDVRVAGIAAVAAMSVGTALAVSVLAVLAVSSRKLAVSMTDRTAAPIMATGWALSFGGGLVIALLGTMLLSGSFNTPQHPLL